jgi:hypothetical protein
VEQLKFRTAKIPSKIRLISWISARAFHFLACVDTKKGETAGEFCWQNEQQNISNITTRTCSEKVEEV